MKEDQGGVDVRSETIIATVVTSLKFLEQEWRQNGICTAITPVLFIYSSVNR